MNPETSNSCKQCKGNRSNCLCNVLRPLEIVDVSYNSNSTKQWAKNETSKPLKIKFILKACKIALINFLHKCFQI